jgi:ADP-ribose pyrophosphatase YjhB (NUDIX family)
VALPASEFSPAVPNAVIHPKGRWVDLVFTAVVPAGTPIRPDGAEILDVAWHPIDALPPVTPATARLLAHYRLGPYAEYPEVTR